MLKIKYLYTVIILFAVSVATQVSYAGIAVIVNPANNSEINPKDVKRIFLDQRKVFSSGFKVLPVDQLEGSLIRRVFTKKIIKKSEKKLRIYWSKHLFNGNGSPPPVKKDDDEVKHFVALSPGGIGYIDEENVDDSVKVVFTF